MIKNSTKLFYKFIKPILGILFKFYYNPRINNKEYIPSNGPIIIVGNHIHTMDQCPPMVSTKRVIRYMAKKEYFDGPFSWFFKLAGCISVNRNEKDNNATEEAIKTLNNGGAIGLFPEGTRNRTEKKLLPFKFGAVSLAKKTNALIIPFGTYGEYKFRSKTLNITFGKPFKVGDKSLEEANKELENIVLNLIEESKKEAYDYSLAQVDKH